ncbi:MAG: glycosyltransferase family 2 protein [Candidatus Omnitrophica bacterium]|nr:glycosyltransferase family 2 protein [Candidatus Omnitrophota bacterium]
MSILLKQSDSLTITGSAGALAVSIIIPAYNEDHAIEAQLQSVSQAMRDSRLAYEIIVVDDGSTDGTSAAVTASKINITHIRHRRNRGYGAALKTGIHHARGNLICIIDADGTYPVDQITPLTQRLINGSFDMVVAARTGKDVHVPFLRRPAKWVLTKLAAYLVGRSIPDLNSGLRVMRKETLLRFMKLLPDGFSFTTTITMAMLSNGYDVDYMPINYNVRIGTSKIQPVRDTLNFTLLIIRIIIYFHPLKIFIPISFCCFAASLLLILFRVFVHPAFAVTTIIFFVTGVQLFGLGLIADLINRRTS